MALLVNNFQFLLLHLDLPYVFTMHRWFNAL